MIKKYQICLLSAVVLCLTVLLTAGAIWFFTRHERTVNTEILLDITFSDSRQKLDQDNFEVIKSILFKQLADNAIDISEASAQPIASNSITLKINNINQSTADKIAPVLIQGKLHFRLVHENNAYLIAQVSEACNGVLPQKLDDKHKHLCPPGYEYMTTTEFHHGAIFVEAYFVKIRPEMDGRNIKDAYPRKGEYGDLRIVFKFNEEGKIDFARVTQANIGRQLAVVFNGKLYTAPTIQTAIQAGSGEITGQFSEDEAKIIAKAFIYAKNNVSYAIKDPASDRLQPFKINIKSIKNTPCEL